MNDVYGESLGVSLLFDSRYCQLDLPFTTEVPAVSAIKRTVSAFKDRSADKLREIAQPENQRKTALHYGHILRWKMGTPPDKLVARILNPHSFSSVAVDWGIKNEAKVYLSYQPQLLTYDTTFQIGDFFFCRNFFSGTHFSLHICIFSDS